MDWFEQQELKEELRRALGDCEDDLDSLDIDDLCAHSIIQEWDDDLIALDR